MRALAVLTIVLLAGCGGDAGRDPAEKGLDPLDPRVIDLELEGWKTDFSRRTVSLAEIRSGGPPKDGIPAIDRPRFAPVHEIDFLEPREPVIELVVEGGARAYPLQILTWHEIVNDTVADVPVVVTFCPLCNTALVFDRRVDGRTLDFGTTGKLRHSDLVMYDRQTESWWQQFGGRGIVGRYAGERLDHLPARNVSWSEFRRAHPDGVVLTRETGYARDYGRNPYEGYDDIDSPPIFPAANDDDDRLPPKERVVFIERDGESVAVPFSTLAERRRLEVKVGGHRLVVRFRKGVASALDASSIAAGRNTGAAQVLEDGRPVAFSEPFWFAVAALRPRVVVAR